MIPLHQSGKNDHGDEPLVLTGFEIFGCVVVPTDLRLRTAQSIPTLDVLIRQSIVESISFTQAGDVVCKSHHQDSEINDT
jgi:hypothetical protein